MDFSPLLLSAILILRYPDSCVRVICTKGNESLSIFMSPVPSMWMRFNVPIGLVWSGRAQYIHSIDLKYSLSAGYKSFNMDPSHLQSIYANWHGGKWRLCRINLQVAIISISGWVPIVRPHDKGYFWPRKMFGILGSEICWSWIQTFLSAVSANWTCTAI